MLRYFKENAIQQEKHNLRLAITRGRVVAITGPGKRLYWQGLWKSAGKKHRALVQKELAAAKLRAQESLTDIPLRA